MDSLKAIQNGGFKFFRSLHTIGFDFGVKLDDSKLCLNIIKKQHPISW